MANSTDSQLKKQDFMGYARPVSREEAEELWSKEGFQKLNSFMIRAMQKPSVTDIWYAWYPVRYGALGTGRWVWLRKVWRNRCGGTAIYQPLSMVND